MQSGIEKPRQVVTEACSRPNWRDHDRPREDRDRPFVSVVFSFWNEELVLGELVRRTRLVFDGLLAADEVCGYELIFVDDASTDASLEILESLAGDRPDIRVLSMSRNFGVSPCVLAGMLHARGDAVVYMDADLQDPPEMIPQLVAVYRADRDVDVVHTIRSSRAGESLIKKAITRLGYAILRAVCTIDLPLEAGDFKLLSRRAVQHVARFREKRPFLRGLVCWIGFKQAKVVYHREPRHAGRTKFPILGASVLRNFIDSALISFSDVPLKLASLLGLVFSTTALVLVPAVIVAWLRGADVPGWAAVLVATLFLGGVQLLCIGILGNYISSIFLEGKSRPNFIIRSTFGFEPPAVYAARLPALQTQPHHEGPPR